MKKKIFGFFVSRRVIAIASFLFVSGFVINQGVVAQKESQIQVGQNSGSIKSGNQTRGYLFYIPEGYDGKTNLPLVLIFHGSGTSAKDVMSLTDLSKVADEKKFIIAALEGIYPLGWMNSWNADLDPSGVNDVEFVKDLIREISSKLAIDQKRIYATGFSGGARMSSRLACELSNVIAAIGPVAGLQFPDNCAPTRSVSVIAFHGTADRLNNYSHQVNSPPTWKKGVEDSVSSWVKKNGCNNTPMTSKISEDVTQITYGGCKDNTEVVFFRINEGGHTWPDSPLATLLEGYNLGKTNKDINASNLIWSFFEAHPIP